VPKRVLVPLFAVLLAVVLGAVPAGARPDVPSGPSLFTVTPIMFVPRDPNVASPEVQAEAQALRLALGKVRKFYRNTGRCRPAHHVRARLPRGRAGQRAQGRLRHPLERPQHLRRWRGVHRRRPSGRRRRAVQPRLPRPAEAQRGRPPGPDLHQGGRPAQHGRTFTAPGRMPGGWSLEATQHRPHPAPGAAGADPWARARASRPARSRARSAARSGCAGPSTPTRRCRTTRRSWATSACTRRSA
jgi:hypothetical protein